MERLCVRTPSAIWEMAWCEAILLDTCLVWCCVIRMFQTIYFYSSDVLEFHLNHLIRVNVTDYCPYCRQAGWQPWSVHLQNNHYLPPLPPPNGIFSSPELGKKAPSEQGANHDLFLGWGPRHAGGARSALWSGSHVDPSCRLHPET